MHCLALHWLHSSPPAAQQGDANNSDCLSCSALSWPTQFNNQTTSIKTIFLSSFVSTFSFPQNVLANTKIKGQIVKRHVLEKDQFVHILTAFGDKLTVDELDDIFGEFEYDDNGDILTKSVVDLFVPGAMDEKKEEEEEKKEEAPSAEAPSADEGAKKKKKKKKAAK